MRFKLWAAAAVMLAYGGSALADDPCATLLCMAGKAGVAGGSVMGDCSGPISDFFSIIVKKHGKFKASSTSKKRREYLESCQGSAQNSESVDAITKMFGKVRSQF